MQTGSSPFLRLSLFFFLEHQGVVLFPHMCNQYLFFSAWDCWNDLGTSKSCLYKRYVLGPWSHRAIHSQQFLCKLELWHWVLKMTFSNETKYLQHLGSTAKRSLKPHLCHLLCWYCLVDDIPPLKRDYHLIYEDIWEKHIQIHGDLLWL